MQIKSRFKEYSVKFVDSLQEWDGLVKEADTFFVIDRKVYELYQDKLPKFPQDRLFLMEADEDKKNMDTVLAICEQMTGMAAKRNIHLVSMGGGIVQDITGFVAANLYRGIRWTFYPTTLLAACDSCIGGKSSLNYKGFKNLLGSFYPPDAIRIYPHFFCTLEPIDYCSGLGEVVKFSVIAGKDSIERIEQDIDVILDHDYDKLQQYIKTSLEFKKKFIEEDEFDRGVRILLNFAHTFGHAFEVSSNYAIPHGSAVALGMMAANYISVKRGFIETDYAQRIEKVCHKILTNIQLQEKWFLDEAIIKAIRKDKKQINKDITAVLIQQDYSLGVYRDVKEDEIREAVRHITLGKTVTPFSVAYQKNRIRLADAIPLPVPLCISIEPVVSCNFKCQMCWQSTKEFKEKGGPFSNMDDNIFQKALTDIKELTQNTGRKIKLIKLYHAGEPLLHPKIGKMVEAVKKADVCTQVEITSNASLLTSEIAADLVENGLDYFRASIYSVCEKRSKQITNTDISPDVILEKIKYLRSCRDKTGSNKPYISAKIMDTSEEEIKKFKAMYDGVADEAWVDIPWDLAGTKEKALDKLYGAYGSEARVKYHDTSLYKQRKACRYPFTHLIIKTNGDVIICCMDWPRMTYLGNIMEMSLADIWQGEKLYNFRMMMLRTKGVDHPLCGDCELPLKDCPEDNIDDVSPEKLSAIYNSGK